MKIKNLHDWDLSYQQARQLQTELATKISSKPLKIKPKIIAGLDCAFTKSGQIIAAAVLLSTKNYHQIETAYTIQPVKMPYIPGLLSFREAPACIEAIKKLKNIPDLFMIDGQGIAHPRKLGLAAHLGLFFDKPTIGCAKSRLTGSFTPPNAQKGSYTYLKDNKNQTIGAVLRTRTNIKPLFVSIGNKCSLKDVINITLSSAIKYRLPEPTRLADKFVAKIKSEIAQINHSEQK